MEIQESYFEEAVSVPLETFIKEKENVFLEKVKGESDKDSTYNIFYDVAIYQDIASIHFILYVYSGGAHDIRFDQVVYYDLNALKEVFFSDLVQDNQEFYQFVRSFSKEKLLNESKDLIYDDMFLFEDGLEKIPYFVFESNHFQVIFPPYQVGPWSSGEIHVEIPYSLIASYLKI